MLAALVVTLLAASPLGSAVAPPNDLCANAQRVESGSALPFTTVGASATAVSPGCAVFGGALGPDVWFRFQAPVDGLLSLELCGTTSFDSVIAVYEAASCAELDQAPRGCNDDACGLASRLEVSVRAGGTYRIQVGGASSLDSGSGILSVDFQPGESVPFDDCADAGTLACGGSAPYDLAGASLEAGEPAIACSTAPTLGSVWFHFVASAPSALLETLEQVGLDSTLAVYAGSCGALVPLACNDDLSVYRMRSRLLLEGLVPGATYHVQVSGHVGGPSGSLVVPGTLALTCPAPCETHAAVTRRSAPFNPEIFEALDPPLLASSFALEVDRGAVGGGTVVLFAFDTPASLTLGNGQKLLAIDGGGSGELFTGAGLTSTGAGPTARFLLAAPNDPALCGASLHTQAVVLLVGGGFVLSNAQDLVLGL